MDFVRYIDVGTVLLFFCQILKQKTLQKILGYVKMRLIGNDKKITIIVKARKTRLKWRKNKWQEKLY